LSLNDIILKNDLKDKFIFLSASIPTSERNEKEYLNTNPLDITDAIVALTRGILSRRGKIVFGGHPTISPLILSVAKDFISDFRKEEFPLIYIFQSQIFEENISKYTKELLALGIGVMKWTKAKKDRNKSLEHMRKEMITNTPLNAAIFIGGMEGTEEEYSLITRLYPNIPVYPIATTGGAANKIFIENIINQETWKFPWNFEVQNLVDYLNNSKEYSFLIKQILLDIKIKPIYVLFMFREELQYDYEKFQRILESLNQKKNFKVLSDRLLWKKSHEELDFEINKKESEMVQKADVIVRLIHPTSKSGNSLHEGAKREFQKAMRAGKPVIEIYYEGVTKLLKHPFQENHYKYRILINLKKGENLEKGIQRGLEKFRKIKVSELYSPEKKFGIT